MSDSKLLQELSRKQSESEKESGVWKCEKDKQSHAFFRASIKFNCILKGHKSQTPERTKKVGATSQQVIVAVVVVDIALKRNELQYAKRDKTGNPLINGVKRTENPKNEPHSNTKRRKRISKRKINHATNYKTGLFIQKKFRIQIIDHKKLINMLALWYIFEKAKRKTD